MRLIELSTAALQLCSISATFQVFRSFLERTSEIENLSCDIFFAIPEKYSLDGIGKQVGLFAASLSMIVHRRAGMSSIFLVTSYFG